MASTMHLLDARQRAALPAVRFWLYFTAFLIFCMVIVGGATRLTDSGLSITEWQPLLGAIPPLTEADWLAALEKYRQIPEYQLDQQGHDPRGLQVHLLVGMGAPLPRPHHRRSPSSFPLPVFALTGRLSTRRRPGAAACSSCWAGCRARWAGTWCPPASVDRVDVSQYRLSAHLTLATVIFAAILWVAIGLGGKRHAPRHGMEWAALALVALILLQVAPGGFVAGLDAGMGYNTWPLMDGALVPPGLMVMEPGWRNLFENAMTVQFNHRLLAYVITLAAVAYALATRTQNGRAACSRPCCLQVVFGIWTLLCAGAALAGVGPSGRGADRSRRRPVEPARSSSGNRLVEIGDDVVDVLDADRQADHVGRGACKLQLILRQLAVGGRGRVDDQRARVADIGEVREQLHR